MLPTGHLLAFALVSFVLIIVPGAVFMAIAVLCDSTWALAAGTARAWFTASPRRLELVGGTGGLVMIGIGASLALTGRRD
jgi:threonine/homoserine/homoserine lactone efflux protein